MRAPAVLLAWLLVAAPGLGLTFVLFPPGRASIPLRAALVVPLGFAAVGLVGVVLALLHALAAPVFLGAYLAGTAVVWILVLRRHALREHVVEWRREVASERFPYLLGLVAVVAFALVRLTYSPLLNLGPGYYTSFRYWADGLEMADAHGVPQLSLQWGTLLPYTVSKMVLNSFHAVASFVLGRGPLEPLGALLFVCSVALALAAFSLARELSLRFTAPLVPLLLLANPLPGANEIARDLVGYRAENWGRVLMLAAVAVGVRALRYEGPRRLPRDAVVAGGLFGVAVGTHLVPAAVGLGLLGSYGVVRAFLFRSARSVASRGVGLCAVAGVVGVLVLLAPGGDLGFDGVLDAGAYDGIASDMGLPDSFDPTRYVATGEIDQPDPPNGAFYDPPHWTYAAFAASMGARAAGWPPWGVLAAAAVALALVWLLGEREIRLVAAAAFVFGLVLLVTALAFSLRYDVFVLARFGERRLFDYSWLAVVLLGSAALEGTLVRLAAWEAGRTVVRTGAAVVLVAAGACVLPRDVADRDGLGFLASGLAPLAWIEQHVPCEGRILADRRTLGSFEVFTRHAGVIEGMGPHLRPAVLARSVRETLLAGEFFRHPSREYLDERGVAAVVVTAPRQALGGVGRLAPETTEALDGVPFLSAAARSASVTVYEVVDAVPPPPGAPDVRTQPGYLCG